MVSALPESANEEREILSKLDSFNPLLILLNVSGMLPSLRIYSSHWKYKLYNVFSVAIFLSYIPLIISQLIGIYKYYRNLTLVTVIIFQLAAYFDGMVNMAYFIYNRKRLLNMFYLTENKFNSLMQKVGNREKQTKIIAGNKKFERILSIVAMAAFLADMCTWCVLPSIVRYLAYFGEEEAVNDEEVNERLKYFILVMWLPQNASVFPFYEMLHIFQFLSVWGVVGNYAAGKLIIVSLYYHLSSHFRILASAIEDIDVLCNTNVINYKYDIPSVEMSLNTAANSTNISLANLSGDVIRRERDSILKFSVMEAKDTDKRGYNSVQCSKMVARNDLSSSTFPEYRNEVIYLIRCIKYHQTLLK